MFASRHSCHDIPIRRHLHSLHTYKRTFTPWHTPKVSWCGHSHHGILSRRHLHSLHTQAGISIHCILIRGICIMACTMGHLHHGILPSGHSHHGMHHRNIRIMAYPQGGIYIMTYLHEHLHHDIPTWTFTSWHTYMGIHNDIPTSGHLHHDIPTRSICIMTYPLEGICTTRFLHLHPCKEAFASQLNMCASTIMDELCICTPASWKLHLEKETYAS